MAGGDWSQVTKSRTQLSHFTFFLSIVVLEKKMATTPVLSPGESWTEGPGGLQSMGLQELDTTKQLTHTLLF